MCVASCTLHAARCTLRGIIALQATWCVLQVVMRAAAWWVLCGACGVSCAASWMRAGMGGGAAGEARAFSFVAVGGRRAAADRAPLRRCHRGSPQHMHHATYNVGVAARTVRRVARSLHDMPATCSTEHATRNSCVPLVCRPPHAARGIRSADGSWHGETRRACCVATTALRMNLRCKPSATHRAANAAVPRSLSNQRTPYDHSEYPI